MVKREGLKFAHPQEEVLPTELGQADRRDCWVSKILANPRQGQDEMKARHHPG